MTDALWIAPFERKVGARLFLTLLFKEAIGAIGTARSKGSDIDVEDEHGVDGFAIFGGPLGRRVRVTREEHTIVLRFIAGEAIAVETLEPSEPFSDDVKRRACEAIVRALRFLTEVKASR
jgi:hypothetical protein